MNNKCLSERQPALIAADCPISAGVVTYGDLSRWNQSGQFPAI